MLASSVLPGIGHRMLGRPRAAAVRAGLAVLVVLGIALGAWTAVSDPAALVGAATDTRVLLLLGAVGALIGLLWISGPIAAALLARRTAVPRAALVLVTALAVLAPLGATTWWVSTVAAQHRLLTAVSASGRGLEPVDGRYTILLMGLDDDPLRDQVLLPDSLTVVSVDAVTGRSVLLGVPRTAANFLYPPGSALAAALPEGTRCLAGCGVNHTYQYGLEHPELYPGSADPGADAVREAVSGYTGLPVQATVSIRMTGFVELIDALGGVSVVVGRPVLQAGVPDDGSGRPVEYGPPIEAGLQHLDGSEALWFARSRVNTSDADRSERQGCLQAALFRQADPLTVLTRFQAIARAGGENVSTSLPAESLPALARLAVSAREHPLLRVELGLPLTLPEQPDIDLVHRTVAEAIAGTGEQDAATIEVPPADAPLEVPAAAAAAPVDPDAAEPACSVP
ncbi:LCP family protein [Rathayibacter festucae]|uniref:LytR family transcriptional regulator n=1 Tax=Rathayibacter festucae DSM 15932 TaxID=1328866 RepID=A0A3Q9UTS1_9MICO|nr:LCP family protein [Rathayibacter festucae]AZZ52963.1 LytR family transcriptional regulator [Rathayibacter festucae DSM 15932]